jgi:predicted transcriptional regulator
MRTNEVISVYVDTATKAALEKLANEDDRTVAALLRRVIRDFLTNQKTRKRNAAAA